MEGGVVTQSRLDQFYEQLNDRRCCGDPIDVETFLLDCIKRNRPQDDVEYMVAVCDELGSFYRGSEQYDHSLAAFERAKTVAENAGATKSTLYAATLNNMAGTYRQMRDYDRAIALFQAAKKLYQELCGKESAAYVGILNNLSLTYQETGLTTLALACLEDAVALIESTPALRFTLGITYSNLTTLYYSTGDRDQAMRCMNRALQEYERCPDEDLWHYADALNSMGGFLYAEGNYWQAIALYRKSASHTLRCEGETLEYAAICQNMRWCYEGLGQLERGASALEEAVRIYTRLLGADHERTRTASDDLICLKQRLGGSDVKVRKGATGDGRT